MLTAAARLLRSAVRASDTVARVGGDEFVVLTHVANRTEAEALRQRLTQRLSTEAVISGQRVGLCASVGLTTTHDPSASIRELLSSADRDMYRRKHDHRPDAEAWP